MKILEWKWKSFEWNWELYLDNILPKEKLITSVVSCCFYKDNILLTKNSRWWELAWWHIDDWENVIESLHREIKEEVWADVVSHKLIWHYKLNPLKPVLRKNGGYYPFPNSYIPFYLCECDNIQKYTGEEILGTKIIKISEINEYDFINKESIKLLLKYR
jgi:hypothetical protein